MVKLGCVYLQIGINVKTNISGFKSDFFVVLKNWICCKCIDNFFLGDKSFIHVPYKYRRHFSGSRNAKSAINSHSDLSQRELLKL